MSASPDPRDRGRSEPPNDLRRADGEPGYRSGRTLFLSIAGIVGVMVVLALALAWIDSKMLNDINDYRSAGLTDLPANNADPGELLAFAADHGFDCTSGPDLASGAGDCGIVIDVARTVNDYKSNQSLVWGGVVIGVIALLVAFTMFVHQASSNLRHLGAEGQRFTPGWAVGWFFIPFMNVVQPARVFRELMQASASTETRDPRAWQNANPPGGLLVSAWWTLVVAAVVFGPRGVSLFVARNDIDDWARAARILVWSDLFQVLPLVLTVTVAYRLQRAQEIRHLLMPGRKTRLPENS